MAARGLDPSANFGRFSDRQRAYLAYHRVVLFAASGESSSGADESSDQ